MSKADDYRKRADALKSPIKRRSQKAAATLIKRQKALNDMADNEDWLEGKPGSQLKTGKPVLSTTQKKRKRSAKRKNPRSRCAISTV